MYKLNYRHLGEKQEIQAESLEEILSMALGIFDNGGDLGEVEKDGKIILWSANVYQLIGRCYY